MNDDRRKALRRAISLIEEAKFIIEESAANEHEYYDNMPESIQSGEKGDKANEAADALDSVESELDNAITSIEETLE